MKKTPFFLSGYFIFIGFTFLQAQDLIIASGSRGGNYYTTAQYVKNQYNKIFKNCHFSVIETNGSNENIELLKNNSIDFAIVQRNILINSIYKETEGIKNLAVIIPLFQEKLWVYTHGKQPLNIKKIDSLSHDKKFKIGITSKKSYSYSIFKKISKFLDINTSNVTIEENNYSNLIKHFKEGKLDAIVSFSLPLDSLENSSSIQRMYLSKKDAKMIEKRDHNVFATSINTNEYSLGSWSFLIGSRQSIELVKDKKHLIKSLLKTSVDPEYQKINNIIKRSYATFVENKSDEVLQLRNLPISNDLQVKIGLKVIDWMPYLFSVIALFVLSIFYYLFKGSFLPKFNASFFWYRYKHFQFGFVLLIIIYFSSIELLVYAEKSFYRDIGIKSPILNMTRSDLNSWLLITTVTGNSNGVFPLSLLGKVMLALNSLNFWIGTILIGVSEYATYKINKKRKQGHMETKHTNHLVIFGWNSTTEDFIVETIRDAKEYNSTKIKIVCVVKDIEEVRCNHQAIKNLHDHKRIDIIQGDALNFTVLEKARVEKSSTVILLSEDNSKLSDERTAMRAHAISRYTKKKKNQGNVFKTSVINNVKEKLKNALYNTKKQATSTSYKKYKIEKTADTIYMIAELNNDDFRESLIDAEVNEIVVAGNYKKAIIKQSLFNHGISKVLDEIMQYNEYNEFYKVDLSKPENKHLHSRTFDELLIKLREHGILLIGVHIVFHDEHNNIIIDQNIIKQLLEVEETEGITRDIIVNPTDEIERNRLVDEDDHLIVLATNVKSLKGGIKKITFE